MYDFCNDLSPSQPLEHEIAENEKATKELIQTWHKELRKLVCDLCSYFISMFVQPKYWVLDTFANSVYQQLLLVLSVLLSHKCIFLLKHHH